MGTQTKLVLLSGGLDSTANLAKAMSESKNDCLCLFIRYGQRAEASEYRASQALAKYYGCEFLELDMTWLGSITTNSLTSSEIEMPHLATSELDDPEKCEQSKNMVWVANRNGLFLNAAASVAEARSIPTILTGFNREEAASFPDNSPEFLDKINESLAISTQGKVRVDSYTLDLDKTQIMHLVKKLDVPVDLIWSCYESGTEMCGLCESCKRFKRAYSQNESDSKSDPQKDGYEAK